MRDRRGAVRLIVFLTHAKERKQKLFIAMTYFFESNDMEEAFLTCCSESSVAQSKRQKSSYAARRAGTTEQVGL